MGKVLDMAREINNRAEHKTLCPQVIEERVYEAMLDFHGVNEIALTGRRTLFQKLKLIAKAEVMQDGTIMLYYLEEGEIKRCRFLHPWTFEVRLANIMAGYIR